MKDACLHREIMGLRRALVSVAPPGLERPSTARTFARPYLVAQTQLRGAVVSHAEGKDCRPVVLVPPPCQRPPPLRLLQQLPPSHAQQPLSHTAAALGPCSYGGGTVVSNAGLAGPAHHPLARPRIRTVVLADARGDSIATSTAGGSNSRQAGGAAAEYHLPEHWQEQMSHAPFGRRRVLQSYYGDIIAINKLESEMRALSNVQLRAKTAEFKQRLAEGASLNSLRVEAFAVVREASWRVLGMRHYDCQLVGGMVLADGQVAEMQTGEGKTLVATLPGYLGALTGRGVHVVTVNDYLAARDAAWMGKVYRFLGLTCAAVQNNQPIAVSRAAFAADVTYVTGQQLGFSFLRDNTALSLNDVMLPNKAFHFAIVDEVDSILIDESRNAMIIAGKGSSDTKAVVLVNKVLKRFLSEVQAEISHRVPRYISDLDRQALEKSVKSRYYTIDEKTRSATYTSLGIHLIFKHFLEEGVKFSDPNPGVHSLWEGQIPWGRLAVMALIGHECYTNGKDYIVRNGDAVIIDQSTGRLRTDTRWQSGLHQAVEAKEGLEVKETNVTTATITFQLFFPQYEWLSGMTGTAQPAAAELFELYGLKVVPIPTNRPSRRHDHSPRLFYNMENKLQHLASEVLYAAQARRPVLIGTNTVQESELVLNYLMDAVYPEVQQSKFRRAKLVARMGDGALSPDSPGPKYRITLLNAKPELVRMEAQVIAQAGLPGAVTISTNMAGRGTDIILGGNPEGLMKMALMRLIYRRLLKPEERETLPTLTLPHLEPYDTDDLEALTRIPYSTPEDPHAGLPRPLRDALTIAILISFTAKSMNPEELAAYGNDSFSNSFSGSMNGSVDDPAVADGGNGGGPGAAPTGISYGESEKLVDWVMDRAEVLRRKVRGALRRTYRDQAGNLERLNYTLCVAPIIESVLAERERQRQDQQLAAGAAASKAGMVRGAPAGPGSTFMDDDEAMAAAAAVAAPAPAGNDLGEEPPAQVWALRAALHLWFWLDQECARYREEVRAAGGLLVIGTSLHESQRIELQLRGRAGRQGDPGDTKMLLDCSDPLMVVFGLDKVSVLLSQVEGMVQSGVHFLEGDTLNMILGHMVRFQESGLQNARLENKKYDAVTDEYRNNLYTLRRLLLCGDDMQRAQIIYVLIQRFVDELVGQYIDPRQATVQWLHDTVPLDSLPCAHPRKPGEPRVFVSPLQAVLLNLKALVNPPDRTTKTLLDFSALEEADTTDPVVRKILAMFGMAVPHGAGGAEGSNNSELYAPFAFSQIEELEVLTAKQIQNLAGYIAGTASLEWPVPAAREIYGNFKIQLRMRTHRRLFGYGVVQESQLESTAQAAKAGANSVEQLPCISIAAGGALIQRPPLHGRFANEVSVLRNYLGEVLIGCYESRHLGARLTFMASRQHGYTDIDAEMAVCTMEQRTLLMWLDALWSCYLEDLSLLRSAVAIRCTNGNNPLGEFRMESNAAFLAMLDNFRDTVVEKLLVPDFSISSTLDMDEELADTLLVGKDGVLKSALAPVAGTLKEGSGSTTGATLSVGNGSSDGHNGGSRSSSEANGNGFEKAGSIVNDSNGLGTEGSHRRSSKGSGSNNRGNSGSLSKSTASERDGVSLER